MAKIIEKRDASVNVARSSQLSLRCGDCLHFSTTAHPSFGQPCKEMGVRTFATAPNCYAPNVVLFRKAGPKTFATLASVISTFSPQQSRILMGLLKSAGSLEKYSFTFLEKVYFKVGDDYLDNYFFGHVLGVGLNGTLAVVGASYFVEVKSPIVAYLLPESVFSADTFRKKKNRLTKAGLLYAPRKPHKNDIQADYEPPTMETSPELLEKLANSSFGKKRVKPPVAVDENGDLEVIINPEETNTKKPKAKKPATLGLDLDDLDDELED